MGSEQCFCPGFITVLPKKSCFSSLSLHSQLCSSLYLGDTTRPTAATAAMPSERSGEWLWWLCWGCVCKQWFEHRNSCGEPRGQGRYVWQVKSYSLYTSLVKKAAPAPEMFASRGEKTGGHNRLEDSGGGRADTNCRSQQQAKQGSFPPAVLQPSGCWQRLAADINADVSPPEKGLGTRPANTRVSRRACL